jgi:hypothetical protein
MMTFEEYCQSKKIDSEAFQKAEAKEFEYLKIYFSQVSPDSFTAQKLFLINAIRRKYWKETVVKEENIVAIEPKKVNAVIQPNLTKKELDTENIALENKSKSISRPKIPGVKIPQKNPVEDKELEADTLLIPEPNANNEQKSILSPKTPLARPKIPTVKKVEKEVEISPKESVETEKPKIGILKPKIPPKLS